MAWFPEQVAAGLAWLRYGGVPSRSGVVLTIQPAPPGAVPAGGGPWVVLELRNVADAATSLWMPEVPGGEVGFEVVDAVGRPVPAPPPAPHTDVVRLVPVRLEPGEAMGVPCDLSRWADLGTAAPGPLRVRAERVPVGGDPHRCRSSWTVVQR